MNKKLTYLVLHCTATPKDRWVSPEDIIRMHTSKPPIGRGWKKVGYSKLILLDGSIHSFVNEDEDEYVDNWEITNGVAGINSISRHICYVGGLNKNTFIPEDTRNNLQLMSMEAIVVSIINKYPNILVAGHYDFAPKACPCFNVAEWCKTIKIPFRNIYEN